MAIELGGFELKKSGGWMVEGLNIQPGDLNMRIEPVQFGTIL